MRTFGSFFFLKFFLSKLCKWEVWNSVKCKMIFLFIAEGSELIPVVWIVLQRCRFVTLMTNEPVIGWSWWQHTEYSILIQSLLPVIHPTICKEKDVLLCTCSQQDMRIRYLWLTGSDSSQFMPELQWISQSYLLYTVITWSHFGYLATGSHSEQSPIWGISYHFSLQRAVKSWFIPQALD